MVLINFYQNRFPFSPTRCILSLPITYVRMKLICEHQQFRGHVTCKIPKTDLNTQCYTFDFGCCVFKWMEKMSIPWWTTIIVPPEYFLNSNRGLLSLIHPLNFSFIRVYPLQFHAEMLLISRLQRQFFPPLQNCIYIRDLVCQTAFLMFASWHSLLVQ